MGREARVAKSRKMRDGQREYMTTATAPALKQEAKLNRIAARAGLILPNGGQGGIIISPYDVRPKAGRKK